MLTQLIEDYQDNETENAKAALCKWNAERDQLRLELKLLLSIVFNLIFGFLFPIAKQQNIVSMCNSGAFFEPITIQLIFHEDYFDSRISIPAI